MGPVIILIYLIVVAGAVGYALHEKKGNLAKNIIIYNFLVIGGFFMVLPFYWMLITSFKSFKEAIAFPPTWIPHEFHPENFTEAWNSPNSTLYGYPPRPLTFGRYFYVSIFTGVLSTGGTLITAALAAYAFAKMRFYGRRCS
jgi:multiple sugar transport system permease protein